MRVIGVGLLMAATLVGGIYWDAYHFEPYYPRLYRVTLELPRLPHDLDGLSLVVFGDLHLVKAGPRERRMIELFRRAAPDVIVGLGDYIDDDHATKQNYTTGSCARELARVLRQIPDGPRKVACLGNWDLRPVPDILRTSGFELVEDGPITIARGAARLAFVTPNDIKSAVREGPTIVLSHIPEAADAASAAGPDAILGAHWHGGQVCLPFIGTLGAETSRYPLGLYRIGNTWLYVTRGVGFHTLPVRFFCRSEVALLTLRSAR